MDLKLHMVMVGNLACKAIGRYFQPSSPISSLVIKGYFLKHG